MDADTEQGAMYAGISWSYRNEIEPPVLAYEYVGDSSLTRLKVDGHILPDSSGAAWCRRRPAQGSVKGICGLETAQTELYPRSSYSRSSWPILSQVSSHGCLLLNQHLNTSTTSLFQRFSYLDYYTYGPVSFTAWLQALSRT